MIEYITIGVTPYQLLFLNQWTLLYNYCLFIFYSLYIVIYIESQYTGFTMLVSGIQQSDSVIHIYVFSDSFHYKLLQVVIGY